MIAEFCLNILNIPTRKQEIYKIHKEDDSYFVMISWINEPAIYLIETYIFLCDENGHVSSYGELEGSRKGIATAEEVLKEHGCTLVL